MSKADLEKSINNLTELKTIEQKRLLLINLDNKGKEDARELGRDFNTAINAMIIVLGLMEDISEDEKSSNKN